MRVLTSLTEMENLNNCLESLKNYETIPIIFEDEDCYYEGEIFKNDNEIWVQVVASEDCDDIDYIFTIEELVNFLQNKKIRIGGE